MENDIELSGVKLHYEESGPADGIPFLLMHGWGCDHTTVATIAAVAACGMHVYNIDLPGHGQSSEPPEVWGVGEYTLLVEQFCEKLGIVNPVIAGHSFGGRIGILMSSRTPVRKLILIDAAGIKPRRKPKYYLKVYSFKAARYLLPLLIGNSRASKVIDRWRGKAGSADYRNSSPRMRAVMSRCVNQDLRKYLRDIKAPTLLVWGEEDTATPMRDARIMEHEIPDAGLVSYPGCGHYSFLDNPVGFRAVMREFLITELSYKPK